MHMGFTLTGPHRDDFILLMEGRAARLFASEGQKKTAIAALRLAEWERLSHRIGTAPLLAIDDFAWPLDASRQALLVSHLQLLGQVFLTAPFLPPEFEEGISLYVERGTCSTSSARVEGRPLQGETGGAKSESFSP